MNHELERMWKEAVVATMHAGRKEICEAARLTTTTPHHTINTSILVFVLFFGFVSKYEKGHNLFI
jgi:hypothetical protein